MPTLNVTYVEHQAAVIGSRGLVMRDVRIRCDGCAFIIRWGWVIPRVPTDMWGSPVAVGMTAGGRSWVPAGRGSPGLPATAWKGISPYYSVRWWFAIQLATEFCRRPSLGLELLGQPVSNPAQGVPLFLAWPVSLPRRGHF